MNHSPHQTAANASGAGTATVARSTAATARTASAEQLVQPKQERAVLTRARILRAAAEVFAEQGYARTSLADVARRVGMTKGAVYFHFKDKDDLAIAVVEDFYTRWPTELDAVQALDLDPLSTLAALMDRSTDAFCDDVMVQAAARLQAERSLINTDLPLPYEGWIELATTLLASGQERGEVRTDLSAEALAQLLISASFGIQHVSDVLHDREDLRQRWTDLKQVLLPALRAH